MRLKIATSASVATVSDMLALAGRRDAVGFATPIWNYGEEYDEQNSGVIYSRLDNVCEYNTFRWRSSSL